MRCESGDPVDRRYIRWTGPAGPPLNRQPSVRDPSSGRGLMSFWAGEVRYRLPGAGGPDRDLGSPPAHRIQGL